MNANEDAWSDEEIFEHHHQDVHSEIVLTNLWSRPMEFSCEMSFDHRMAPAMVIASSFDRDDEGGLEARDYYEIVLYEDGINVWRHRRPDGCRRSVIDLVAFLRRKYLPKTKYRMSVRIETRQAYGGRQVGSLSVMCGDDYVGFQEDLLPETFHAGLIGSEGRCRFYSYTAGRTGVVSRSPFAGR